jgi:hypothetical protein
MTMHLKDLLTTEPAHQRGGPEISLPVRNDEI